ncbi:hypothetical protein LTR29_017690, partial [Friedmanniomyces endolithicus]
GGDISAGDITTPTVPPPKNSQRAVKVAAQRLRNECTTVRAEMAITQANILNALPPELLARIFSYVFAEFPNDIAACRLVNRSFKQNGSRFLLSRVVFALRLKAITKLREVLKHPYFRFHVTELVCDGSSYAEATAMSSTNTWMTASARRGTWKMQHGQSDSASTAWLGRSLTRSVFATL